MVKTQAWVEITIAHIEKRLSDMIESYYFYKERPVFELYDLKIDSYELNNLSGQKEFQEIEKTLRDEMEKKMLIDHDFLPLPSHVIENNLIKKQK